MKVNKKTFCYILIKVTENELFEIEKKNINETILTYDKINTLIKNTCKLKVQKKVSHKQNNKIVPTNKVVNIQKNTQTNTQTSVKRNRESIGKVNNNNNNYYNFCSGIFSSDNNNITNTNTIHLTQNHYITNKLKNALNNMLLFLYDIKNINNVFYTLNKNKIISNVKETLCVKQDFVIIDLLHSIFNKSFDVLSSNIIKKSFIKTLIDFTSNNFIHKDYKRLIECILLKTLRLSQFFERKSIQYKKSNYEIFNHCDLLTNPIETLKPSKTFVLYQDNKKYVFNVVNLMKYIEKKLLYQEFYECYPCKITNPYTNIELKPCELYKIYFHCLYHCITIPLSFTLLFKANMNYVNMLNVHNVYLQNAGLENTVNTMTDSRRLYYLNEMINHDEFKTIISLNLLNTCYKNDKDKLMFLKYEIEYYVYYNYSINIHTMESMYNKLKRNLKLKRDYLIRMN